MENKIEKLRDIVLGESLESIRKENQEIIRAMEENAKALELRIVEARNELKELVSRRDKVIKETINEQTTKSRQLGEKALQRKLGRLIEEIGKRWQTENRE